MKTKEEIELAKRYPIRDYLTAKGIQIEENEKRILCPFKAEKTASFYVNYKINIWGYFGGSGRERGGSIIDLVMIMEKLNFGRAIDFILNEFQNITKIEKPLFVPKLNPLVLVEAKEIVSSSIKNYVYYRGIDIKIARQYCKEVVYLNSNNGKKYYALGFENVNGGFNISMKFPNVDKTFKSIIGNGGISKIIKGIRPSTSVQVFEGFFDFLSYLQINSGLLRNDVIILNSISNLFKTSFDDYSHLNLYLDNDEAGRNGVKYLLDKYNLKTICDNSNIYNHFKDLNQWLNLKTRLVE